MISKLTGCQDRDVGLFLSPVPRVFTRRSFVARGTGLPEIAGDIAHQWVELGERDAETVGHGVSLARCNKRSEHLQKLCCPGCGQR